MLAIKEMRSNHMNLKAKAGGRTLTTQQAVFELKQRVVLSLNKLADRDTQQIGVDELERIAENLTPEVVAPFLSCITDTDSEQKTAVRKECVRVMGTLARFHGVLLSPHLGKVTSSIVKRLKDTDSVVRDACVETVGILMTNVRGPGGADSGESVFVALARPLFESLGEQNRYVQAGSALCLARVIDEAGDPPVSLLSQILARIVKLLKNPHFMAKPAVIELIRSIIQAGGATTEQILSSALGAILESLKCSDWSTRKAASVALAGIAVNAGSMLGSFKTSCLRSLESCRFDKVKPVRDTIIHAIQCWKSLPGIDSPELSEAGSSTKENFVGDYSDVTCASDSGWRDTSSRKVGSVSVLSGNSTCSTKKRTPLIVREACPNFVQKQQKVKGDDWHIEISVPKTCAVPRADKQHKRSNSKGSCSTNTFIRVANPNMGQDDYDMLGEKPECSSISQVVSEEFENKHVTLAHGCLEDDDSTDMIGVNHRSNREEINRECIITQERKSLDSTVTDLCSQSVHGCCLHTTNELAFIKRKLLEVEAKQSNILDLLKVFIGNSVDSVSTLQSKVHNLENAVDKISQLVMQSANYSSNAGSKPLKKNQSASSSPRLSTCTPRPSVDVNYRQPSLLSLRNRDMSGDNMYLKNRSSTTMKEDVELWTDPILDIIRNPTAKNAKKSSIRSLQSSRSSQARETKDLLPSSTCDGSVNTSNVEGRASFWKRIRELLRAGEVESAYAEVLCSGDDNGLIELMNKTGPVLERLSIETADDIISTLGPQLLDQRFLASMIPWLQQMVDLSTTHESRHLVQPTKARMEFLLAIQEAADLGLTDPVGRASIAHLASKLHHIWAEAPCRRQPLPSGPGRSKCIGTTIPKE